MERSINIKITKPEIVFNTKNRLLIEYAVEFIERIENTIDILRQINFV